MGTPLTGHNVKVNYLDCFQAGNNGAGLSSSAFFVVCDGAGVASGLQLSKTRSFASGGILVANADGYRAYRSDNVTEEILLSLDSSNVIHLDPAAASTLIQSHSLTYMTGGVVVGNSSNPSNLNVNSFSAYRSDGVTQQPLLSLNNANNASLDATGASSLFTVGKIANTGTSGAIHGTGIASPLGPAWLVHNRGGYYVESYDFSADLPIMNQDSNDNFLWGCLNQNDTTNSQYHFVRTTAQWQWFINLYPVMTLTSTGGSGNSGLLTVQPGGTYGPGWTAALASKTVSQPAGVGGVTFDVTSPTATTHTDGTFDTLLTWTIPGGTFQNIGDKMRIRLPGSMASSGTAHREVKASFGGTQIYDSGVVTTSSNGAFALELTLMMTASGSVSYEVTAMCSGASSAMPMANGTVSGLTLSNSQTFTVTAAASSSGAAASDISVVPGGFGEWLPAAVVLSTVMALNPLLWYESGVGAYQHKYGLQASGNGQLVGQWQDQGPNGLHINMPTDSKRPDFHTAQQNGLPSVRTDGISQCMQLIFPGMTNDISGNHQFPVASPLSLYFVGKLRNANSGDNVFIAGNDFEFTGKYVNGANQFFWGGLSVATMNVGTVYTFEIIKNGGSSAISLNGGTQSTGGDAFGGTTSAITIGAKGDLISNPANFDFFEVIAFNYVLSGPQRTAVLNYLRTKYAHY
jgi:hypothetical protein